MDREATDRQLTLFAPPALSRLGFAGGDAYPYCSQGAGFRDVMRRPAVEAWSRYRHVRFDPVSNSVGLLLDCDGGFDRVLAAVDSWTIPAPSSATIRRANGRAFCAWFLLSPVHRYPAARPRPLQKLARTSEYFHQETGADPSYNRSLGRNPVVHRGDPEWIVEGGGCGYSLTELGEYIPVGWRMPSASKVASFEGRNCSVFMRLCRFAGTPRGRRAHLGTFAHGLNAGLAVPLPPTEVAHIVRHVEKYRAEWEARGWHRPDWIAKQAARGRRSGAVRRANVALRDASILEEVMSGASQAAVARDYGLHRSTVSRIVARTNTR